jgi:hypothetical protein
MGRVDVSIGGVDFLRGRLGGEKLFGEKIKRR